MVDAPKKPDLLNSLKDAKGAFDLFAEANEFRKSPKRVLDPDADIKFLKKLDKEKNNPVLRDAVSSAITEPLNKLPGGFRMGVAAKPLIDAVAPMINYFAQDMMSTAANVAPVIEEIFTAGPPRMETPAPVFEISAPVVEEPAFVPTPVLPPEPVVVTAPKVEAPVVEPKVEQPKVEPPKPAPEVAPAPVEKKAPPAIKKAKVAELKKSDEELTGLDAIKRAFDNNPFFKKIKGAVEEAATGLAGVTTDNLTYPSGAPGMDAMKTTDKAATEQIATEKKDTAPILRK